MSILGITKGTKFEEQIGKNAKGEEQGAGMYTALALLAKEKGLDEVSEILSKIAMDEARHAGLYAVLNGNANQDIFTTLSKMAPIESAAAERLSQFAKSVSGLGSKEATEAAQQIEAVALDEARHGEILKNLVAKYSK